MQGRKKLPLENELRHVLQLKPEPDEERQEFLRRLVFKADIVDEDSWNSLSPSAQEWARVNSQAVEEGKVLSDFNGQNLYVDIAQPKNLRGQNFYLCQEQNSLLNLSSEQDVEDEIVESEEITDENLLEIQRRTESLLKRGKK